MPECYDIDAAAEMAYANTTSLNVTTCAQVIPTPFTHFRPYLAHFFPVFSPFSPRFLDRCGWTAGCGGGRMSSR